MGKHEQRDADHPTKEIWKRQEYRSLQGSYPVLAFSFADVKEGTYTQAKRTICLVIKALYNQYRFLLEGNLLSKGEKRDFLGISVDMDEAAFSLKLLSGYLSRYYGIVVGA